MTEPPVPPTRRALFRTAGALGAAAALPGATRAQTPHAHPAPAQAPPRTPGGAPPAPAAGAAPRFSGPPLPVSYRFFNPAEAAFVEAATDRLIPADDEWPGALWAGVPAYIDGQLAGAYGHGARFYAAGPWEPGLPSQGYQLPLNPSQLYRTALAAIGRESERRRLDFPKATPDAKDAFLSELEAGKLDLGGFASSVFFETLLANTIEGFLSDPVYGGNRDMVGWRMIGFPGAYASYLNLYTSHGVRLDREPMSIAQGEAQAGGHRHG